MAVKAERDGHDYLAAAIDAGAVGVLVTDSGRVPTTASAPVAVVVVEDTGQALLDIGGAARDRLAGPVVAITGSVGKTSAKDLAAAALSSQLLTTASEKSFNNELGVPLTLANAPDGTQVAVIEMGARGPGHIALLCSRTRPTIGVVTAVAAAHTAAFGGLEEVARAKGELVECLPSSGFAVLNADDSRVAAMASRTSASVVGYSVHSVNASVIAEDIRLDAELRPGFRVRSPWGAVTVKLEARGAHQVGNALAALTIAGLCGVDLAAAAAELAEARLSPWRMEVTRTASGAVVLNDAYNANPASMLAALQALAAVDADRRVAVLGVMAELGDLSAKSHLDVAGAAARLGIELIAIGTSAYGPEPAADFEAVLERLGSIGSDDAVLVKGSRVAGLEVLAARVAESS